jgi:hypothetical protein
VDALDQGDAVRGEFDALQAAVVDVLRTRQQVPLHEPVDEVAGRAERQVEVFGDRAHGLAAFGRQEVERAHLRHRQLQLAQEHVHVANGAAHVEVHEALDLVAELATAVGLVVSGTLLLRRRRNAARLALVAFGMLIYTSANSPGYFAQLGQWPLVAMFAVVLAVAMLAVVRLVGLPTDA